MPATVCISEMKRTSTKGMASTPRYCHEDPALTMAVQEAMRLRYRVRLPAPEDRLALSTAQLIQAQQPREAYARSRTLPWCTRGSTQEGLCAAIQLFHSLSSLPSALQEVRAGRIEVMENIARYNQKYGTHIEGYISFSASINRRTMPEQNSIQHSLQTEGNLYLYDARITGTWIIATGSSHVASDDVYAVWDKTVDSFENNLLQRRIPFGRDAAAEARDAFNLGVIESEKGGTPPGKSENQYVP